MDEKLQLKANSRDVNNKKLRDGGFIPAVIYGPGVENRNIKIAINNFEKIYKIAGESTLIDLTIDNKELVKVIVQDVQREEVDDKILHVDFYQVNMKEKIHTEINLIYTGESAAVKSLGGTLVTNRDTIEIKCLPTDLIKEIEIDISVLKTFEDSIKVSDLKIPETIELITDPKSSIATVAPPRTEAELSELDSEVKENIDQVETKQKDEDKDADTAEDETDAKQDIKQKKD